MAYSEKLAEKIRKALAHLPNVEEKKMFGRIAFMVNGKMCLTAGPDRIMCRIDPELHEEALQKKGSRTVKMGGKEYKGYLHISEDALQTKAEFMYWVNLALEYNEKVKSSAGKKRKK